MSASRSLRVLVVEDNVLDAYISKPIDTRRFCELVESYVTS